MMKTGKFLSLVFFVTAMVVSCSKDNDPVDDNVFVGTYRGSVSYSDSDSSTDISTDEGRITLVKVGDNYNFDFSDGIPSLTGIKIDKNENVYISSDGGITIDEGNLVIVYTKDGEVWGADCTR